MKIDPKYADGHPQLKDFLKTTLPALFDIYDLGSLFHDKLGLDGARMAEGFRWQAGPTLKVARLVCEFGQYTPGSGVLVLDEDVVTVFEQNKDRFEDALMADSLGDPSKLAAMKRSGVLGRLIRNGPNGQEEFLVEVIVLHLLTHWGYDTQQVKPAGTDVGNLFENAHYGAKLSIPGGGGPVKCDRDDRVRGGTIRVARVDLPK